VAKKKRRRERVSSGPRRANSLFPSFLPPPQCDSQCLGSSCHPDLKALCLVKLIQKADMPKPLEALQGIQLQPQLFDDF